MKLGRLECHCVYSESGIRILDQIEQIDAQLEAASYKKALRMVKDTVLKLREEQKTHATYTNNYMRAQCEFHKVMSIMPPDAHGYNTSVLRTSAWRAGDLDELRRPVNKKKNKKNKKKQQQQQQKASLAKIGKPAKKNIKSIKKHQKPEIVLKPIVRKPPRVIKIKREPGV